MEAFFEAIIDFFAYLSGKMENSDLNPYDFPKLFNKLEYYANMLHINSFVGITILFFLPFVVVMIIRRIYCKFYFKENFKREYTPLLRFFYVDITDDNSFFTKIDKGTLTYIATILGICSSIWAGSIGYLVFEEYAIVSLCILALLLIIMFFCIRENIRVMGVLKSCIFIAIQLLLCLGTGAISIFAGFVLLVVLKYALAIFATAIFMVFGVAISLPSAFKDDNGYVDRATRRYHEYTGNSVNKYDYVSEDTFGHIRLRDEDGDEIEIYQDSAGNYRRVDNDKLID